MERGFGFEFTGLFIPDYLRLDKSLNLGETLYLSAYKQYGESTRIADEIMSVQYGRSTIAKIKKKLIESGRIESGKFKDPLKAKSFVINHSQSAGNPCEWCGKNCYILEEHHFPVPKYKGGKETVRICQNCHRIYHLVFEG